MHSTKRYGAAYGLRTALTHSRGNLIDVAQSGPQRKAELSDPQRASLPNWGTRRKLFCYDGNMLRLKKKRRASQDARAAMQLAGINASIVALDDEDLLDIADIFRERRDTPLAAYAFAEVERRKLSL